MDACSLTTSAGRRFSSCFAGSGWVPDSESRQLPSLTVAGRDGAGSGRGGKPYLLSQHQRRGSSCSVAEKAAAASRGLATARLTATARPSLPLVLVFAVSQRVGYHDPSPAAFDLA